jgi:N-acetylated-alpha-linked acidic dipeptidase
MRDVDDPKRAGKTLFAASFDRALEQERTELGRAQLRRAGDLPIAAMGSGSDYTAFIDHLQIASLDLGFGGEGGGGVYHSAYDTFHWYTNFSDKDFAYGAALSRTIGTVILRLANADVLPFEFTATARTLKTYVDDIDKARATVAGAPALDLAPLRKALDRLERAAVAYNKAAAGERATSLSPARLAELNRLLYTSERAFRHEAGLPRRPWFKHLVYAPGFYTGYGVKTLPGIREGVEQKQWDEAKAFVTIVAAAVDKLAAQVEEAGGRVR